MILVDANLLVYAFHQQLPQHRAAVRWLERQFRETSHIGLPWASLLAFLRLSASRRIFSAAPSLARTWKQVQQWLGAEAVWVPQPTERHGQLLATLLPSIEGKPELVADAHLAALALEHGLILCSTDGDFGRFTALRWWNPLADPEGTSIR